MVGYSRVVQHHVVVQDLDPVLIKVDDDIDLEPHIRSVLEEIDGCTGAEVAANHTI